jgi:hypothetical protein
MLMATLGTIAARGRRKFAIGFLDVGLRIWNLFGRYSRLLWKSTMLHMSSLTYTNICGGIQDS